ncbi:MAG TPA: hypothetical protein VIU64_00710 [Polyangia bacterium]
MKGARAARLALALAGTAVILSGTAGQAAELRVRSSDTCAEAEAITEQAEGLLGRPLAQVDGIDFDVDISPRSKQLWLARIDAVSRTDGSRRTREITGRDCSEVAEAAAVAIAMSIDSDRPAPETAAHPRAGSPPPVAASLSTAAASPGPPAAAPDRPSAAPIRPQIAVGLIADAGALPGVALGPEVEGSLRRQRLRVTIQAALFPSDSTRLANGAGGDFQLVLAGISACFGAMDGPRLTVSACAGGEVGRMAGKGTGVAVPELGAALWAAGRGEVDVQFTFADRFLLFARAGVAIPTTRRTFAIDGTIPVHRANAVTVRSGMGIGVMF